MRLTLAAYRESGGVHGAVARLAEGTYARVPDERKQLVRAVMLRLVGEGEGDAPVRRRAPLAELDLERNEDVADVLATLADSRLVTVSEGNVEVAHEALLREWPRLREWIEEDTEGRRLAPPHHPGGDANGTRQGAIRASSTAAPASLPPSTGPPITRSTSTSSSASSSPRAARHRRRRPRRVRRTNRRLRGLLAGVAVLLAAAVAGGIFAVIQRGEARDAETAQLAQRLGAQALVEDDLDRSLLLARQAVAIDAFAADPELSAPSPPALAESGRDHARPNRVPPRDRRSAATAGRSRLAASATDFSSSTPGRTRGSAESRR